LGGNLTLLSTIKLPKNLKLLSDRLPKSKYDQDLQEVSSVKTSPDEGLEKKYGLIKKKTQ
jgi:hypothetical protein